MKTGDTTLLDRPLFVACIRDEEAFTVYGPFFTRKAAELECDVSTCNKAHLIAGRVGEDIQVFSVDMMKHIEGTANREEANIALRRYREWRDSHKNSSNEEEEMF